MLPVGVTILFIVFIAVTLYFIAFRKRARVNYPPSPGWSFPILGHMVKLGEEPYKTLISWKQKYGPIVAVDFGSFPSIAISDAKLIKEVLADWKCAGRPDLPMFKDRSGGERHGILFSDGDEWTEIRRFTLRHLRDFGFGKKSMENILHDEANSLNERLKESIGQPIVFRSQLNTAVLNSIWSLIASERFEHEHPKLQHLLQLLNTDVAERNLLSAISMFNPWLAKYFPKLSGYSELLKDLELFLDFHRVPLKAHRETLTPGQPRDLMDVYLEATMNCTDPTSSLYGPIGERVMLTVFLDLFIAGAETTSTTLTFFGLYLASHPEVQEKMYTEIQSIVGTSRLPSLEDKNNMPYTEAVTLEVMRFSSMVPTGLFHNTLVDTEIGGYNIPKNTMIITNLYSCHFDEDYWGDPLVFRPERFLSPDGKTVIRHEYWLPFSYGKRVCLGENLARAELFIFSTSVIQRFKFEFDPENTPTSLEPSAGMILLPPHHKLIFTERVE